MATKTKPPAKVKGCSDPERLKGIRMRVKDVLENHGEDVQRNQLLRFPAGMWKDMDWLVKEVQRLAGIKPAAYVEPEPEPDEDDEL